MFKYCTVGFMLFDGKHFFENVIVQDVLTQKVKFHTLMQYHKTALQTSSVAPGKYRQQKNEIRQSIHVALDRCSNNI